MTSVPLNALPSAIDYRRDQYGRYLIVPREGGKPRGYTRVTTVAGTLDSLGGLAPWKAAMAASGIIMRRGLRAQWEALLAEYGDPWYAGPTSKALAKKLVEESAAVGGANDRKEMGSALHTITALVDVGKTPTHLTEETEADLKHYREGLAAANVTLVPGMVEVTVVLDDYLVAGTFDRLAQVPGFELPLIADLKTGAELSYSWQTIAVQMAAYSRANNIYRQGPAADGSQDVRLDMPGVNKQWGLIMWLPIGGELELYLVNLDAGWEAFSHSMWTRGWRNKKVAEKLDSTKPHGPTTNESLESTLAASLEQLLGPIRAWLQGRIDVVGAHPEARKTLGVAWGKLDFPTLRASNEHSAEQLAVIEKLLDDVERRWELPWPPAKPGTVVPTEAEAVAKVLRLFPGSTETTQPKEPA